MTAATGADAVTGMDACDDGTDPAGVCWDCGGPCLTYKGSDHGWRCRACIDRYLDEGDRAWQSRSDKAREKITRNLLHGNNHQTPVTANDRRREGGGSVAMCRTAFPASVDHRRAGDLAVDRSYVPRRDR